MRTRETFHVSEVIFKMSKATEYIENAQKIIQKIADTQSDKIDAAARLVTNTLECGHKVFAFGTGHSHMLAEELFYRAGGLVKIHPIFETALMLHESASVSTLMERLGGYGEIIFNDYGLERGDTLLLFSNSGRNGAVIDLALLARKNEVSTIVVTNMNHTLAGDTRHPSGKKLFELGDVVLDNCGCVGDASISFDDFDRQTSPTSTVTGALILNAMSARAIEFMLADGFTPEVFASSNIDGGDEINDAYIKKYRNEIRSL